MNISPRTVEALCRQGWDMVRVADRLPANAADEDIDFSALVALRGLNQPSLITLRLSVADPENVTRRLLAVLPKIQDQLGQGCALTIEDTTVRIRALPID